MGSGDWEKSQENNRLRLGIFHSLEGGIRNFDIIQAPHSTFTPGGGLLIIQIISGMVLFGTATYWGVPWDYTSFAGFVSNKNHSE
jgi:hypothetical protein